MGDQQLRHQAPHFRASQGHVPDRDADQHGAGQGDRRRHAHQDGAARHRVPQHPNQPFEGEDFRAGNINGETLGRSAGGNDPVGIVLDKDRLQSVLPVTRDSKNGQVPDEPRNVVDQNVGVAKQQGRADDRIGQSRIPDPLLELRFAAVIGKVRFVGIGDADVDQPANPGLARRVDQHARVPHRRFEARRAMIRTDPVGVVERVHATQSRNQSARLLEIEREDVDLRRERTLRVGMVGQRPD